MSGALPLVPLSAGAQGAVASPAVIAKATSPDAEPFITDGEGRTLYTLAGADGGDKAACDADCMKDWTPYVSDGRPLAKMVLPGMISTVDNDGVQQVTYRENPLYLFNGDSKAGDTSGQGVNDMWYMVSVLGEPALPIAEVADAGPVRPEVMIHGQEVYATTCAQCHGAQGQGAFGTKLEGFERLANGTSLVRTVLLGLNSMPALGPVLDDEQVAAVTTYVRNSWGNEFGAVSPEQVEAAR